MKKFMFPLIVMACFSTIADAQQRDTITSKKISGKQQQIKAGVALPVHLFSHTHFGGFSAQYAISSHRFGLLKTKPQHLLGFTATTGAAYYFGKKEEVVNLTYHYPSFTYIYIQGGILYNAWQKINFCLTTGPGLSINNGTATFNIGASLEGSYYINEKFAVSPGIQAMKQSFSDPIFAASLNVSYCF